MKSKSLARWHAKRKAQAKKPAPEQWCVMCLKDTHRTENCRGTGTVVERKAKLKRPKMSRFLLLLRGTYGVRYRSLSEKQNASG